MNLINQTGLILEAYVHNTWCRDLDTLTAVAGRFPAQMAINHQHIPTY